MDPLMAMLYLILIVVGVAATVSFFFACHHVQEMHKTLKQIAEMLEVAALPPTGVNLR